MPGLGLGLGLNKRQQNRFAQAAQTPGGGAGWLAQHPNIQQRVNQVDPTSQQATNIGNFVGAGQIAPNAAQRFQPGGQFGAPRAPVGGPTQPPQGSGATGANKPSGGGGGAKAPAQGDPGSLQGQLTSQGGPAAGQQQPMQTPQYWNQPGYQGPVGPNGEAPGTWGAMTQGPGNMGGAYNMANQGAGAANAGQQQMNPQTIQAFIRALMGPR